MLDDAVCALSQAFLHTLLHLIDCLGEPLRRLVQLLDAHRIGLVLLYGFLHLRDGQGKLLACLANLINRSGELVETIGVARCSLIDRLLEMLAGGIEPFDQVSIDVVELLYSCPVAQILLHFIDRLVELLACLVQLFSKIVALLIHVLVDLFTGLSELLREVEALLDLIDVLDHLLAGRVDLLREISIGLVDGLLQVLAGFIQLLRLASGLLVHVFVDLLTGLVELFDDTVGTLVQALLHLIV